MGVATAIISVIVTYLFTTMLIKKYPKNPTRNYTFGVIVFILVWLIISSGFTMIYNKKHEGDPLVNHPQQTISHPITKQ